MFSLSADQLMDIAAAMAREIHIGLTADGGDLLCIPTFIPLKGPPGSGTVLAIDVGGTNVRCAVVEMGPGNRFSIKKGPIKEQIPVSRGMPIERATFLETLAAMMKTLNPPPLLPVGYCFSYPARPLPDGDAVILNWTKELFVKETIGEKAGRMLRDYVNHSDAAQMSETIVVMNDTVTTLLAGMTACGTDGYLGLISGTGTNMAILLPPDHIPKLKTKIAGNAPLPVNLESGNFHPPHLTSWDAALDASSSNPSHQRFEKAVSGVYLPYLFKLACPESDINPEEGSAALFQKAYQDTGPAKNVETAFGQSIARQLIERSAKLTAAALAGSIKAMQNTINPASICITAEGGLFHAHPRYRETTQTTLTMLTDRMGMSGIQAVIQTVADANLKGCTLAALALT
ncbi:MAG: hypothetical protein SWH61_13260 [Thermodesulfobacteriota bacterium]|nr:hypothetical protein [Thermodesulfobacteriota bacterium]